jgi:acyl carrier protein
MEDKELFGILEGILREKLELDEKTKVTLESDIQLDLGADSLDRYELLYEVEERLGITIPDEIVWDFHIVKDGFDYIRKKLK